METDYTPVQTVQVQCLNKGWIYLLSVKQLVVLLPEIHHGWDTDKILHQTGELMWRDRSPSRKPSADINLPGDASSVVTDLFSWVQQKCSSSFLPFYIFNTLPSVSVAGEGDILPLKRLNICWNCQTKTNVMFFLASLLWFSVRARPVPVRLDRLYYRHVQSHYFLPADKTYSWYTYHTPEAFLQ